MRLLSHHNNKSITFAHLGGWIQIVSLHAHAEEKGIRIRIFALYALLKIIGINKLASRVIDKGILAFEIVFI